MRKLISALALCLCLSPSLAGSSKGISSELKCLADNVYFEARGEQFKGKLAVAAVTLNRLKSPDYPKTICKVVYQPSQFSWTKSKHKITDLYAWTDSLLAASMAMEDSKVLGNFPATHFHTKSIKTNWRATKVATIGQHIFYRM